MDKDKFDLEELAKALHDDSAIKETMLKQYEDVVRNVTVLNKLNKQYVQTALLLHHQLRQYGVNAEHPKNIWSKYNDSGELELLERSK